MPKAALNLPKIAWRAWDGHPKPLKEGQSEVWLWRVEDARANARDMRQKLWEHICGLLDAYLETSHAVVVRSGKGKPVCRDFPSFHLNLSHTENLSLAAFSNGRPIGIDLERAGRARNPLDISRRFFARGEAAWLEGKDGDLLALDFARLWVCKEAALKMSGDGLSGGLDQTMISLAEHPFERVDFHRQRQPSRLFEFIPAGGFCAALCGYGVQPLEVRDWLLAEWPSNYGI